MKITFAQAAALVEVIADAQEAPENQPKPLRRPRPPRVELLRGDHGKLVVVVGEREPLEPLNSLGAWIYYVGSNGQWERVA